MRKVSTTSVRNTKRKQRNESYGPAFNRRKEFTPEMDDMLLNHYFEGSSIVTVLKKDGRDEEGTKRRLWGLFTANNGRNGALTYLRGPTRVERTGPFMERDFIAVRVAFGEKGVEFHANTPIHLSNILARPLWDVKRLLELCNNKTKNTFFNMGESEESKNKRIRDNAKALAKRAKACGGIDG